MSEAERLLTKTRFDLLDSPGRSHYLTAHVSTLFK